MGFDSEPRCVKITVRAEYSDGSVHEAECREPAQVAIQLVRTTGAPIEAARFDAVPPWRQEFYALRIAAVMDREPIEMRGYDEPPVVSTMEMPGADATDVINGITDDGEPS